jgi:lipoyl(octanoyl) transferase
MRWTLLVDPVGRPGWHNMAVDQALLGLAAGEGRAFLRLYRWEPFCLSFGRHEPALRRYDRAAIDRLGLDAVRRPTGGRAVWHADELTYAVAAPADTFGSLPKAYERIHAALAAALQSIGFPAVLASPPARASALHAGACFASPVGGEVMLAGRKVVGSAQLREQGAMLQHGSLLLGGSQEVVSDVTEGVAPPDGSIALAEVRGGPVGFDEVAAAVSDAARAWGGEWGVESVDNSMIAALAMTHADRFRSDEWTWRR